MPVLHDSPWGNRNKSAISINYFHSEQAHEGLLHKTTEQQGVVEEELRE